MGVSSPPRLETINIKKMGKCLVRCLSELVCKSGRMSNILAPVVPIKLARMAPIPRKRVLMVGVAFKSPDKWMPPEIIKREASKTINEIYSKMECSKRWGELKTSKQSTGPANSAMTSDLLVFFSQKCAASKGNRAIESSMRPKGNDQ